MGEWGNVGSKSGSRCFVTTDKLFSLFLRRLSFSSLLFSSSGKSTRSSASQDETANLAKVSNQARRRSGR